MGQDFENYNDGQTPSEGTGAENQAQNTAGQTAEGTGQTNQTWTDPNAGASYQAPEQNSTGADSYTYGGQSQNTGAESYTYGGQSQNAGADAGNGSQSSQSGGYGGYGNGYKSG